MAKEIGTNGLIETWASTGNVTEPSAGKVAGGWEFEEQPPHEHMNWIHNILGQQINYLMRSGIPAWNATTDYLTADVVTNAGVLWVALAPSTGSAPAVGNTNWQGIDATTFATAAQGALADTALQSGDISGFETSAQLDVRDVANRARANHTGTQAIPTISGLQGALDGKQPLDAELTALAGVTSAANKVPYFSGPGSAGTLDFPNDPNLNNIPDGIARRGNVNAAVTAARAPDYISETLTTLATGTLYQFAHALGVIPSVVYLSYVCQSNDQGWVVGEELPFQTSTTVEGGDRGASVAVGAVNIRVKTGSDEIGRPISMATGNREIIVASRWKLKVRAWV